MDAERDGSPVIELSSAEHDLTDFLRLATAWASRHLPEHAASVTAALARALILPTPTPPGGLSVPPESSEPRATG